MKKYGLLVLWSILLKSQFPGPVGSVGTTAVFKDSSIFINWASQCVVARGYMDIAQPTMGLVSFGADTNGTKKAGANGYVSLGDGGYAVLTFPYPVMNGPGPDFAVFENAFNDTFLELAFVEVSSNGTDFYRFPSVSLTQTLVQIGPFDNGGDATKLHNLAGKYRVHYGTPFDLQDMANIPGLDINHISHIKIIDVVGCIQPPYATYDSQNHVINEPYPTAFASGGFDLDAVGVIHQNIQSVPQYSTSQAIILPQPAQDFLCIFLPGNVTHPLTVQIISPEGRKVMESSELLLNVGHLPPGIYGLKINGPFLSVQKKILISR